MKRSTILMLYPNLGFSGVFVRHIPLSLLYASIKVVKHGYNIKILDTRLCPDSWKEKLKNLISSDVLAVGISVMTGKPIKYAVEIGKFVKSINPTIKVVWGGPHATFFPESILENDSSCDYVVSGYGVEPFFDLIECLSKNIEPSFVKGVYYRKNGEIVRMPKEDSSFEFIDFREIPYHLIEDYGVYGQLDQNKRIFSMYSSMGCPYKCSFCSAPAEYSKVKGKKWYPINAHEVVDHIEHVVERYKADYIYFIDNDSFVNLSHLENVIGEIKKRKINVKLGFRGARINEIKKMTDGFLDKLAEAGTDILHIGVESGSNRILRLINKNCTVEDIIDCNIKLARHPEITSAYNFIIGIPSESLDEIKKTRDLMLRLVNDNPHCIIFQPNRYRPLPGTELFNMAAKDWGHKIPETLEEWSDIETEGDFSYEWYTKEIKKYCELLLISSYFIDNKAEKVIRGNSPFYKLIKIINKLYRPIAMFRLKNDLYQFLIEYKIYRLLTNMIKNIH